MTTLAELVSDVASRVPTRAAMVTPEGVLTYADVADAITDAASDRPPAGPPALVGTVDTIASRTSVEFVTSGTSGTPKRVLHSHGTLLAGVVSSVALQTPIPEPLPDDFAGLADLVAGLDVPDPPTVFATAMPHWTIAGFVITLRAWVTANTVVHLAGTDPPAMLAALRTERVNALGAPPLVARRLLRASAQPGHDAPLPDLLAVGLGGGPASAALVAAVEDRWACLASTGYGMTETAGPIAMSRFTDSREMRMTSVGYPVPGVSARVVDDELHVSSASLFLRYVDPDAPGGPYTLDGRRWFATGDRATIRDDGAIVLAGRVSRMILRGGRNIEPADIEAALTGVDVVRCATVVGVPNRRLEEEDDVVAVVVLDDDAPPDVELTLRRHCVQQLEPHAVPTRFVFADSTSVAFDGSIPVPDARRLAQA